MTATTTMVTKPGTKKTKGKQRIQIGLIENKERRQVTFSKRKDGLLKKASELSLLCGAHVATVIFSKKQQGRRPPGVTGDGNVFAMGTPSVDHVLQRFAPLPAGVDYIGPALEDVDAIAEREALEATVRRTKETMALVDAEVARMNAVGTKVLQATANGCFWWEADVQGLGEAELMEFARALQRLKDNVRRYADKLQSPAPPAAAKHQ
ncbi:hypothetical protein BS78_10G142200 [Paspalum vaginatum]|nr:hypothetical protein BS78_10G142200 [Paspalum vaginatum]